MSPPDSWLNAAPAADAEQIAFVEGQIRPAGTFSFVTGAAHFYILAAAFVIYALAEKRSVYSRWLVWPALFSVAIVQPISGSRTLVLGCGLVAVGAITFGILNPQRAHRIFAMAVLIGAAVAALSLTSFFQEATGAFMTRWDTANAATGGVNRGWVCRFFAGFADSSEVRPAAGCRGQALGGGAGGESTMMS